MFAVTLRGTGVHQMCSVWGIIDNVKKETLDKISQMISEQYNLDVYDFSTRGCNDLVAWTSRPDIIVDIEGTQLVEC